MFGALKFTLLSLLVACNILAAEVLKGMTFPLFPRKFWEPSNSYQNPTKKIPNHLGLQPKQGRKYESVN